MKACPISLDRPIVFVSAQQRTAISNINPERLSLIGDRLTIFYDMVSHSLSAVMRQPLEEAAVATWFASRLLLNPAFVRGLAPVHHEVIILCKMLQDFDPDVFGDLIQMDGDQIRLSLSYSEGTLHILDQPIDLLAHGWMAMIKIMQEIVSSVSAWEQVKGSVDIRGTDALILIDELDAHLHPRWQTRLIPFLKEQFLKATFFISTHSPLIVRDTEPGEVYELIREENQVSSRRLGNPRDWFLADVYSQAFHVDLPPPGSEGTPSLVSMLLDFAEKVRVFKGGGEQKGRESALKLYEELSPRVLKEDPRRETLDQLREMLG